MSNKRYNDIPKASRKAQKGDIELPNERGKRDPRLPPEPRRSLRASLGAALKGAKALRKARGKK